MQNTSDLPSSLDQVVVAIGESATLALVEAFGGTTQRLPAMSNIASHHFVAVIGEVLLTGLVKTIGSARFIYIPKCVDGMRKRRDQAIVRDYLNGVGVEELARKHYLSDRHVWRILKETNMQDDRQRDLF